MDYLIKHPDYSEAYAVITKELNGWVLSNVIVPDEHREQGLGTDIVQQVMSWCKTKGIKKLYFLASNEEFWATMVTKFPKNVRIDFNLNGEIRP